MRCATTLISKSANIEVIISRPQEVFVWKRKKNGGGVFTDLHARENKVTG